VLREYSITCGTKAMRTAKVINKVSQHKRNAESVRSSARWDEITCQQPQNRRRCVCGEGHVLFAQALLLCDLGIQVYLLPSR
jgi:hypothetical protein